MLGFSSQFVPFFFGKNRTVYKFVKPVDQWDLMFYMGCKILPKVMHEKIHCKNFDGSLCCCMIYVSIIYIRTINKAFLLAWVILVSQDQFWVGTWLGKWELSVSKIWIETRSDFWELGLVFGTRFGTGSKFSLF